MLVRIANRESPDQTASSEAVSSGSALFCLCLIGAQNFRTFTVVLVYLHGASVVS